MHLKACTLEVRGAIARNTEAERRMSRFDNGRALVGLERMLLLTARPVPDFQKGFDVCHQCRIVVAGRQRGDTSSACPRTPNNA